MFGGSGKTTVSVIYNPLVKNVTMSRQYTDLKQLNDCVDHLYTGMQQSIALYLQGNRELPEDFLNIYHDAVDRIVSDRPELRAYAIRSAFRVLVESCPAHRSMRDQ